MRVFLVFFVVTLVAMLSLECCSTQIDGNVLPWEDVHYEGNAPVRDVSVALHLFREVVAFRLDDRDTSMDDLDIIQGDVISGPGVGFAGYTLNPGRIVLDFIPDGGKLATTALNHELMHVYLWRVYNDPDEDHAEGDGPWTPMHDAVVAECDEELARLGL